MANLNSKSIFQAGLTRILVLGALALCGSARPALAQDALGGNFTLNESARFGNTVLAAGQYKFLIEPIGNIRSIQTIREGSGHLVLVVLRPEKSGPVASMFAMASPGGPAHEINELILGSEKAETLAETMNLEKEGLVVDFNWTSPKSKSPVVAQQAVPIQSVGPARTGGTY
jgi:hypothetical protein